MRWEDENYVRVYTRDTVSWKLLSWEARALFLFLCRKMDRAGVMDVGPHGDRGVAAIVDMPIDVVERALAELLADGCIRRVDGRLLMPNFIEAQEAKMSPKLRAKLYRDRRKTRAEILSKPGSECPFESDSEDPGDPFEPDSEGKSTVTSRDDASRSVTDRHATVTQSHSTLRLATLRCSASNEAGAAPPTSSIGGQLPEDGQGTLLLEPEPAENGVQSDSRVSEPKKKKARKKRAKSQAGTGFKTFIESFTILFRENRAGADPAWGAKQGKIVKTILGRSKGDVEVALSRARKMFEMSPKWPAENPDLQTLLGHWDKFAPTSADKDPTVGRVEPRSFDEYPDAGSEEESW